MTTSCRSSQVHQFSGQQLTQSSRLNRRPFAFTTDVELIENARISQCQFTSTSRASSKSTFANRACQAGKLLSFIVSRICADRLSRSSDTSTISFERGTAGQVRSCWRDAVSDQQSDKRGHTQTDRHTYTNKPTKR